MTKQKKQATVLHCVDVWLKAMIDEFTGRMSDHPMRTSLSGTPSCRPSDLTGKVGISFLFKVRKKENIRCRCVTTGSHKNKRLYATKMRLRWMISQNWSSKKVHKSHQNTLHIKPEQFTDIQIISFQGFPLFTFNYSLFFYSVNHQITYISLQDSTCWPITRLTGPSNLV